jgi:YfiH family protein
MPTQITPPAPADPQPRPPVPAGAFAWQRAPWGLVLVCPPLAALARHAFTSRDLDPGRGLARDDAWGTMAAWLGVPAAGLWRLDQVHGCRAVRVDGDMDAAAPLPSADAALTVRTDVAVAVKAADCVPILLAHPGGAVAAVHAGWRGTAQGIAGRTVRAVAEAAGGAAADIVAAIGPSIGPCCYEVGPEVRETFHVAGFAEADLDRWFLPAESPRAMHVLDLWRANRDHLVAAGVASANVHVAGLCTATHNDWFWSYRREGSRAGRLLAAIRRGP